MDIPLGGPKQLIQVGLLGLRRETGGRSTTLSRNNHHGRFRHTSQSYRLGHQREPAAGVPHMARVPTCPAPTVMFITAISSSACFTTMPCRGP